MSKIVFQGKTYEVSDDERYEPLPLPDWLPDVLPGAWKELAIPLANGWGTERAYHRAYVKYDRVVVLVSCARQLDGKRWLHVSVSQRNMTVPSWELLCEVKDLLIGSERTALQVLPARAKHVNIHRGCLHLWSCLDGDVTPDFTGGGDTI
jgi:hypothetical protein